MRTTKGEGSPIFSSFIVSNFLAAFYYLSPAGPRNEKKSVHHLLHKEMNKSVARSFQIPREVLPFLGFQFDRNLDKPLVPNKGGLI